MTLAEIAKNAGLPRSELLDLCVRDGISSSHLKGKLKDDVEDKVHAICASVMRPPQEAMPRSADLITVDLAAILANLPAEKQLSIIEGLKAELDGAARLSGLEWIAVNQIDPANPENPSSVGEIIKQAAPEMAKPAAERNSTPAKEQPLLKIAANFERVNQRSVTESRDGAISTKDKKGTRGGIELTFQLTQLGELAKKAVEGTKGLWTAVVGLGTAIVHAVKSGEPREDAEVKKRE